VKQTDPIFIAEFANGHRTCTAVFCPPDKLDPARGMFRARRAFEQLMGHPPPFPIVRARFEFNADVLATYDGTTLSKEMNDGRAKAVAQ